MQLTHFAVRLKPAQLCESTRVQCEIAFSVKSLTPNEATAIWLSIYSGRSAIVLIRYWKTNAVSVSSVSTLCPKVFHIRFCVHVCLRDRLAPCVK